MIRSYFHFMVLLALPAAMCNSPASPAPEILTLEVAPARVECVGEVVSRCLLVREGATAEWRKFYGSINGFTHEEGFRYRIRVERSRVANPPADGSSYRYRLVELLSKEPSP
jgi:hypothetical protein